MPSKVVEKIVTLTYDEFCVLRATGYSRYELEVLACEHLNVAREDIMDVEFDYHLTYKVYVRIDVCGH